MPKLLLATDGSENSLRAVSYLIKRASIAKDQYQVELVNVQYPLHGTVATFVNGTQVKQHHLDEGMKMLTSAETELTAAGIAYTHHVFVGQPAEVISRFAEEQRCDEIIIGSRGMGNVSNILVGSVASKIIDMTTKPVVLVK